MFFLCPVHAFGTEFSCLEFHQGELIPNPNPNLASYVLRVVDLDGRVALDTNYIALTDADMHTILTHVSTGLDFMVALEHLLQGRGIPCVLHRGKEISKEGCVVERGSLWCPEDFFDGACLHSEEELARVHTWLKSFDA